MIGLEACGLSLAGAVAGAVAVDKEILRDDAEWPVIADCAILHERISASSAISLPHPRDMTTRPRTAVFVGWGRFDGEINRIRANIPLIPLSGSCSSRP